MILHNTSYWCVTSILCTFVILVSSHQLPAQEVIEGVKTSPPRGSFKPLEGLKIVPLGSSSEPIKVGVKTLKIPGAAVETEVEAGRIAFKHYVKHGKGMSASMGGKEVRISTLGYIIPGFTKTKPMHVWEVALLESQHVMAIYFVNPNTKEAFPLTAPWINTLTDE